MAAGGVDLARDSGVLGVRDVVLMIAVWLRWSAAQFAAIFCLVHAAMLVFCGMTRATTASTILAFCFVLQAMLFYLLHYRFQRWANDLDPLRSDRLISMIKHRNSRLDPDW